MKYKPGGFIFSSLFGALLFPTIQIISFTLGCLLLGSVHTCLGIFIVNEKSS